MNILKSMSHFKNLQFVSHIKLKNANKYYFQNMFYAIRLQSTYSVNLSFSEYFPLEYKSTTPIIILHGLLGSKQNWRGLAKAIAKNSGRKVFALDARNHGDSPHHEEFSYEAMCSDVKHFMHSHNLASSVLIGHSMGGRTAIKLALEEENLVEKLIVVDISPGKMPKSSSKFIPEYMVAMQSGLSTVENLGLVQARKAMDEYLAQSIPESMIRQFLLTNLTEKNNKVAWKVNLEVLQKRFHSEVVEIPPFTGRFSKEVLFICGGESPYVKPEDHPIIKELFPRVEILTIPGAGHWVHSEKPADFLDALKKIL